MLFPKGVQVVLSNLMCSPRARCCPAGSGNVINLKNDSHFMVISEIFRIFAASNANTKIDFLT